MMPNTFVIGAMKSATTSLCTKLAEHPDVFMATPKEPDFFSRDEVYGRGLKWYQSRFSNAGQRTVVAEGSTSYTKQLQYPRAASRLAEHVPHARLIYIVRDPVDRIKSHWAHEVLKGRTRLSANEFARSHPEAIDISSYWRQLNAYREHFDDHRILVLFLEQFRDQPAATLNQCFEFLQISQMDLSGDDGHQNVSSDRQLDRWPLRMFRGKRWFDVRFEQWKETVPQSWRPALKRVFKSGDNVPTPELDDDTVNWIVDSISRDVEDFLSYCGQAADYWSMGKKDTRQSVASQSN